MNENALNPSVDEREIEEYRKAAYLRAITRKSGVLHNEGIRHANILIESMIGMCSPGDEVFVYSGILPQTSYENPFRITAASKIKVILDNPNSLEWLSHLPQQVRDKIEIFKINHPRPKHFFYTSSGAYRVETNSSQYSAIADFKDGEVIKAEKGLAAAFAVYLADSEPVPKPDCKSPEAGVEVKGA